MGRVRLMKGEILSARPGCLLASTLQLQKQAQQQKNTKPVMENEMQRLHAGSILLTAHMPPHALQAILRALTYLLAPTHPTPTKHTHTHTCMHSHSPQQWCRECGSKASQVVGAIVPLVVPHSLRGSHTTGTKGTWQCSAVSRTTPDHLLPPPPIRSCIKAHSSALARTHTTLVRAPPFKANTLARTMASKPIMLSIWAMVKLFFWV